jgi:hypothetical protein
MMPASNVTFADVSAFASCTFSLSPWPNARPKGIAKTARTTIANMVFFMTKVLALMVNIHTSNEWLLNPT